MTTLVDVRELEAAQREARRLWWSLLRTRELARCLLRYAARHDYPAVGTAELLLADAAHALQSVDVAECKASHPSRSGSTRRRA